MAIVFTCKCGRRLKVSDAMAGRRGKCPSCGGAVVVPDSSDPFDIAPAPEAEAESQPCPSCKSPISPGAVVCVNCGYHRVAGTRMKTSEEEKRQEKPSALRIGGANVPIWAAAVVVLLLAGVGVWYWQGPAQKVLVKGRRYVRVVNVLDHGQFVGGGTLSVGRDDGLLVTTPDDAGDYLLLEVALKQSFMQDHQPAATRAILFNQRKFALQPADGGASIPARLLYLQLPYRANIQLSAGGAADYRDLLPSVEPSTIDTKREPGMTTGLAQWTVPQARGQLEFTSFLPVGGGSGGGGVFGMGHVQLTGAGGTVVELDYAGDQLNVTWPSGSSGWWSRSHWDRPVRSGIGIRHPMTLLFERPVKGGTHTLLYDGQPIATVKTFDMPARRQIAPSPLKQSPGQQSAQGGASNNPMDYLSVLARARQQGKGIVAASNLHQFGLALQMFVDQQGRWPRSIDELLETNPGLEQLLPNPRTGAEVGFIYEPPPVGSEPSQTPVLWEAFPDGAKDPDGAVLYADGHIE